MSIGRQKEKIVITDFNEFQILIENPHLFNPNKLYVFSHIENYSTDENLKTIANFLRSGHCPPHFEVIIKITESPCDYREGWIYLFKTIGLGCCPSGLSITFSGTSFHYLPNDE